jgi:hypothetical protein
MAIATPERPNKVPRPPLRAVLDVDFYHHYQLTKLDQC